MEETLYRINDPALCPTVRRDLGEMQAGTYTLIGIKPGGEPIVVRRFLKDDVDGILYYGMSENLPNRIGQLRQTICSVYEEEGFIGGNHVAGWKLGRMQSVKSVLPSYDRFRLRVRPCQEFKASGEAHWSEYETKMLQKYRSEYGESPPLNG